MKKVILTLLCLCAIPLLAQKPEADKKFKLYEYSEAIPLYKQYLAKSPADYDATKKLALAYKYINNINGSIEAYQSLIKLRDAVPEDWCDLVQLLRISGNLTEAKVYAIQYQNKNNGEKAQNNIQFLLPTLSPCQRSHPVTFSYEATGRQGRPGVFPLFPVEAL